MKRILFLFFIGISIYGQSGSSLIISEVMFYPAETNGEFIEIYNASATETVDLSTVKFKYYSSASNTFGSFIGGTTLEPGKYALVLQGNYDYANGIYKNLVPANAIVLKLNTNNFGSSGMANTTSRDIYLLNTSDQIIDAYIYSADNSAGYSDEKITLTGDNSAVNWKNSLRFNGTPGSKNSVSPMDYDLKISLLDLTPQFPVVGDTVRIRLTVKNLGMVSANQFSVKLYHDSNKDSTGQTSEEIFRKDLTNLLTGDSLIITAKYYTGISASNYFLAIVDYLQDENLTNNKIYFAIAYGETPIGKNELVINEIMYAPINDEPEWVEIYNNTKRIVNLKNCKIGDNTSITNLVTTDYFLNPDEYLVICGDARLITYYSAPFKLLIKSWPSLSNSGDDVIIKNASGQTIDSVKYNPSWGGSSGKSLERLSVSAPSNDASNWKTAFSIQRATPGMKNSAFNPPRYSTGSLIVNEIMYEPETGNAEFIELYNTTSDSIQIIGLEARIGSGRINFSDSPFKIPTKEYFVLASDSSIYQYYSWLRNYKFVRIAKSLGLSNDGTTIVIKDFFNTMLDSLSYSPSMHNRNFLITKNKSLERLSPVINSLERSNWNTCVAAEGATPGRQNSIYSENITHDLRITINPNPFSPDSDGFEDFAVINFNLPYKLAQVRIRVFDNQGRLVRTLQDNRPSASKNSLIFDGLDNDGKALRIGIYILLVEFISEENNNVETIKTPIVIARKL